MSTRICTMGCTANCPCEVRATRLAWVLEYNGRPVRAAADGEEVVELGLPCMVVRSDAEHPHPPKHVAAGADGVLHEWADGDTACVIRQLRRRDAVNAAGQILFADTTRRQPLTEQPIHAQVESVSFSPIPVGHRDRSTWQVTVEHRMQRDGRSRWAVYQMGRALSVVTGQFEDEHIPSERTDEWLAAHRFSDHDAACQAAMEAAPGVTWNGRSAAQIAATAAG